MQRKLWGHVLDKDWNDWRWQIANRICTLPGLQKFIPLSEQRVSQLEKVVSTFRFGVTPYYFSLINFKNREHDPVFRQIMPSEKELENWEKGSWDPLNEEEDSPIPGLTHRYPDRVLMVLTNFCPAYCRHCNRKRKWMQKEHTINKEKVDQMIRYITKNFHIREVILSGGEPLMIPLEDLDYILWSIRKIDHVEIIRFGSRIPVTLPQKITNDLLAILDKYSPIWLNTQFNHYREVTSASAWACEKIVERGIPVNNQTVLLKGINDDIRTILQLNHALLKIKVRPYYLFQCDPVIGVEYFRTRVAKGIEIIEHLQGHTSGLAVPIFAVDTPGGGGKVPLLPNYCLSFSPNTVILRNYLNQIYRYQEPSEAEVSKQ